MIDLSCFFDYCLFYRNVFRKERLSKVGLKKISLGLCCCKYKKNILFL